MWQTSAMTELSAAAIETLVSNHRRFLDFLTRRVGDRALAEDILQDAFVKGVARETPGEQSVVAWFYRTLRNAVIDAQRRKGARVRALEAFARELESAVESAAAPDTRDAVCACVTTLAETLKPEYADALQRVEIDGMAVRAYADQVGIEPNNAAVRVHRAREALRKRVMQSCGTCAEHGCVDCTCGR